MATPRIYNVKKNLFLYSTYCMYAVQCTTVKVESATRGPPNVPAIYLQYITYTVHCKGGERYQRTPKCARCRNHGLVSALKVQQIFYPLMRELQCCTIIILLTKLLWTNLKKSTATSVADPDPDPKDPHHFAGSGSIYFPWIRIRIQIQIRT